MQRDPLRRMDVRLAKELGRTPSEIRAMPHSDYVEFLAYEALEADDRELAGIKAKQWRDAQARRQR